MNLKFFIIFLFLPLFCHAQTGGTIVDKLLQQDNSGGKITINSDPKINELIGKPLANSSSGVSMKLRGYRIQAFSGNQQQSRAEAESRAREIKSLFPEISTDVTYKAPVWRLRIGDFRTNEEATNFMNDLKKKYPSLGKEMNIVTDEIKVIF